MANDDRSQRPGSLEDTPSGGAGSQPMPPPSHTDTSFFGQPRGLATLFFTEMWERFSYYGMRGLLILFMTAPVAAGGLGFGVARAGAIYGLYTGFVYLMTLPGGWVADRIVGQRRAVLFGGITIAAGHFSMAIEGLSTFYLGLGLIVIGTGLLKPNISTMVGELYPEGGARRDAGFSIFYMGINIGAFAAPLIVGFLGEGINWHLGFAAAGIGMVLGLIQYVLGGKHLGEAGLYPDTRDPTAIGRQKRNLLLGIGVVAALIALITFGLELSVTDIAEASYYIIVAIALLYFSYVLTAGGLTTHEKKRVAVIGVLFLAAAIFWSGFEQAGSSLNLVAEQLTNLDIAGWEAPASWLQSINPLFIVALAPVFAWLWVWLAKRNAEPSSPMKFAIGLVLLGAGFGVMIIATSIAATGVEISVGWLMLTYLLHTCGELALSPVGLSTITKLAPHRMVGQMMGVWFMATALGNVVAGVVAGQMGAVGLEVGQISASIAMEVFTLVALISVGSGVLLGLASGPMKRLTRQAD